MSDFNYVNSFKPDPDSETPQFLPDTDVAVVPEQNSNLGAMALGSSANYDDIPNFVSTPNLERNRFSFAPDNIPSDTIHHARET